MKGLLKSSKTLDKLYKKKLRQPQEHFSHKQYKEYRNLYYTLKRRAKEEYYASLLNNYKHDIKQTWKVLRPLIGKQSDKMSVVDKFLVNDQVIMEPNEISNKFCDFFCQHRKRHPGPNSRCHQTLD